MNAIIRHINAEDNRAADVGPTETTMDIMDYPHPNNPKLKFWDLPGVGTPRFPTDIYLKAIQVKLYQWDNRCHLS